MERILSSPCFTQNDRLSKFLGLIVEWKLQGRSAELKESLLGVEVFDRKPGFNPRRDSIVRTEAAKLRERLARYYAEEGAGDPIRIDLPKGGYVPVFRRANTPQDAQTAKPEFRWRFITAAVAFMLAVGFGAWLWAGHRRAPVRIAVLPLQYVGSNPVNTYYADGLTIEIIRDLSAIDGLAVRSQTSSFAFKGKPQNVREVGRELGVDYIVEGSVLDLGEQFSVNVQFVRVRDDSPLWSRKFDRAVTSDLIIQDEISGSVVNAVRLTLGRGRRRYETSREAYDLYIRARGLSMQHDLDYQQSIPLLKQVIAKDAAFAPAYASLAAAYARRSNEYKSDIPAEAREMRAAAEQALRLDPLLPEAYDALGISYARDAQWKESEKSFRRAVELDSASSQTRCDFSYYLLVPLGRIAEAFDQLRLAEEADPLSEQVHFELGWFLMTAGRYKEAASYCEKLPPALPIRTTCIGETLLGQGRIEEAIRLFERSPQKSDRANLGYGYARSGRRTEAEKLALEVAARPLQQAVIFAGLGDKERTLDALSRNAVVGPVRTAWILRLPALALVRGDPRVTLLRHRLGLPD